MALVAARAGTTRCTVVPASGVGVIRRVRPMAGEARHGFLPLSQRPFSRRAGAAVAGLHWIEVTGCGAVVGDVIVGQSHRRGVTGPVRFCRAVEVSVTCGTPLPKTYLLADRGARPVDVVVRGGLRYVGTGTVPDVRLFTVGGHESSGVESVREKTTGVLQQISEHERPVGVAMSIVAADARPFGERRSSGRHQPQVGIDLYVRGFIARCAARIMALCPACGRAALAEIASGRLYTGAKHIRRVIGIIMARQAQVGGVLLQQQSERRSVGVRVRPEPIGLCRSSSILTVVDGMTLVALQMCGIMERPGLGYDQLRAGREDHSSDKYRSHNISHLPSGLSQVRAFLE